MDWVRLLAEVEGFQWDSGNDQKNLVKHAVTCQEAESIFRNQPLIIGDNTLHSQQEHRAYALGKTDAKRLLYISFTIRSNRIRIISARDMSKEERRDYEKV
ncbi:MAG: BrnT family toxin [Verrucomicrobiota bacterium]